MITHSDTSPAIDGKQARTLLLVVVIALALTAGCSTSLVDKTPEILRYCQLSESTETATGGGSAGQNSGSDTTDPESGCPTEADGGCGSATDDAALGPDQRVNCPP
jgi:hypothetical protein